jgi:hypothetical protein
MLRRLKLRLRLLFFGSVFAIAPFVAPHRALAAQPPARLLCQNQWNTHSQMLDLNYDESTVNATRASFAEAAITWRTVECSEFDKRNVTYDHKLNRHTGIYSKYGIGILYAPPGPISACAIAPKSKF